MASRLVKSDEEATWNHTRESDHITAIGQRTVAVISYAIEVHLLTYLLTYLLHFSTPSITFICAEIWYTDPETVNFTKRPIGAHSLSNSYEFFRIYGYELMYCMLKHAHLRS